MPRQRTGGTGEPMSPRYFKSRYAVWRFSAAGASVRLTRSREWMESICCIQDMVNKTEITAEEGEPS